ncbi:MAG: NifB/NifX family molybdenum-iron cluster-binding protein [Bacteroidales bacterium]|nr:NifB/NifX family molybdenum-iron cluster-binding protein [Bacteroidales bacterium]
MEKFNIAIPTNDEDSLTDRTGRAKGFVIYEIENKLAKKLEFRLNPHKHHEHGEDHEHGEHTHAEVMEVLSDCSYILVNKVGKHFVQDLKNANIKIYKAKERNIEKAVNEFINH